MGKCIIKIKDKYFEWSTISDAPVTYGMNKDELQEYIKTEYGNKGLKELPERLKRVKEKGTSWLENINLEDTIKFNHAGENEEYLNKEEIYEQYSCKILK
ncbi:MAG: hypothetical protein ACOCRO_09540 [Halanaerobiales bacterium]